MAFSWNSRRARRPLTIVLALGAGCISEGGRRAGTDGVEDSADSGAPDSVAPDSALPDGTADSGTPPLDSGVRTDTVADSATDSRADSAEVVTASCVVAGDCREPAPPCGQWTCPAGVCEVAPLSDISCDDDNLCTGPGTCIGGVCQPGKVLSCETRLHCASPVCDPTLGCSSEVVSGGFCDSGGVRWGTCDGLQMAPVDVCAPSGDCPDATAASSTPLPRAEVLGSWFCVIGTQYEGSRGSTAGNVSFNADGTWSGTFKTAGGPFVLGADDEKRGWCLDHDLGIAMDLGINHFVGQVDPTGELMAATGELGHELLVAIRPGGDVVDVDGSYAAGLTGVDEGDRPTTYGGTLVFEKGCVTDESAFVGELGAEPLFVTPPLPCLTLPNDGLVTLNLKLETLEGSPHPGTFRGAIGIAGDVVIFSREHSATSLDYGMLVMTRLQSSAAPRFNATSGWVMAQHELGGPAGPEYHHWTSALSFAGTKLVAGVFAGEPAYGDSVAFDDFGRFMVSLRGPSQVRSLAGYMGPGTGFGFFYEVTPPDGWITLFEVSEQPAWPSFGFIVRRL